MKTKTFLEIAFLLAAFGSSYTQKAIALSTPQDRNPQVTANNPTKAYNIGMQYYNERKYKEAIPWLEIATQKHKQAYFPLAQSYHSLPGEDNHEQAYWNYAQVIGYPEIFSGNDLFSAYWWLAFFKEDGVGSISKDLKGALFFFERARQYVDNTNRSGLENNIARIKRKIAEGDTPPRQNVTTQVTTPTPNKNSQASAKSGNASAETTTKNDLLFSGTYTISGEVYYREDKEYYVGLYSKDEYVDIKIYEDSIIIKDNKGNTEKPKRIEWWRIEDLLKKIIGDDFARGKKLYWVKNDFIIPSIIIYSVDSEYNIHKLKILQSEKNIWSIDIPMAKGKKEMPRHYK